MPEAPHGHLPRPQTLVELIDAGAVSVGGRDIRLVARDVIKQLMDELHQERLNRDDTEEHRA